jgi:hypothetical protein
MWTSHRSGRSRFIDLANALGRTIDQLGCGQLTEGKIVIVATDYLGRQSGWINSVSRPVRRNKHLRSDAAIGQAERGAFVPVPTEVMGGPGRAD